MVQVTGSETGVRYFLRPEFIDSFHSEKSGEDTYTIIYVRKGYLGKGKMYKVREEAEEVLIQMSLLDIA